MLIHKIRSGFGLWRIMHHYFRASWMLPLLAAVRLHGADINVELQLSETTYTVNTDGSIEVKLRERWHALTGDGRTLLSRIQCPYVVSFETVEFRWIKTLKKDGTLVDGDPA